MAELAPIRGRCGDSLARPLLLAASSSVLMTLAVPNELMAQGMPFLGFIALAPLYVALSGLSSPKSSALVTGLFGALQHGMTSFWLWFFKDFRFWTLGSTTLAYFVVYAVLGLYLWLAAARGGAARPILFTIAWVAFEYQKSVGFLGYPWGLLPYSLTSAVPLLQIADITGVYGITAFLALSNAAIAEAALCIPVRSPGGLSSRYRAGYLGAAFLLTIAALSYGLWRMSVPVPQTGGFRAVLVQTNADPWVDEEEKALGITVRLARRAVESSPARPDLVVFSETLLRRPYAEFRSYYAKHPASDPLVAFIKDSGAWLLTGAPVILDWESYAGTNSAILIDPQARFVDSYAKTHPVPFAEAIPFWDVPFFRKFIQETVGLESGWITGTEYKVFSLPTSGGTVAIGSPICFEDAFPDVCRRLFLNGAEVLVNLTNISWSRTRSAEIQHWAAARFRAIESRRTLVRSTNGGLTCVVDPFGRVIASLPLFEERALSVEVPVFDPGGLTTYLRLGDWFAIGDLLLFALAAVIIMIREAWPASGRGRRAWA
jgi:apolipoprotein N-acyltransferase